MIMDERAAGLDARSRSVHALLRPGGGVAIMGIVNVTPDSFSDGGRHFDREIAIDAALQMERDGAKIVDVGGESTRPGSEAVATDEELERVVPVIEGIRRRSAIAISVDTMKERVARAALDAGADIVNDVSALRFDPALARLVAERGVPVILMHMRGEPKTMQSLARYGDVTADVTAELAQWRDHAIAAGILAERIVLDPGLGFAKTFDHNLELLARCGELARLGPLLIGASRKGFVGQLTRQPAGAARMAGSLAAVAAAHRAGAVAVRVHDVRETADFLTVLDAIESHRPGRSAVTTEAAGA
jgi:dihydropteroate synthase